jgi:hypothetical protein
MGNSSESGSSSGKGGHIELPPAPPPFLMDILKQHKEERELLKKRRLAERKEIEKELKSLQELGNKNHKMLIEAWENKQRILDKQEKQIERLEKKRRKKEERRRKIREMKRRLKLKQELKRKDNGDKKREKVRGRRNRLKEEQEEKFRLSQMIKLSDVEKREEKERKKREAEFKKITGVRRRIQKKLEEIKKKREKYEEERRKEKDWKIKHKEEERRNFLLLERQKELEKIRKEDELRKRDEEKEREKQNRKAGRKQRKLIDKAIKKARKGPVNKEGLRAIREIPDLELTINPLKMKAKKLDRLGVIKQRIYDARDALSELDIQKVKRIYTEIMLDYNTLSDKEKASVYEDIKEVYDDRKNAEAISKK